MEKRLRKNESNLIASGFATMLFGVWLVAKSILGAFLLSEDSGTTAADVETNEFALKLEQESNLVILLLIVLLLLFAFLVLGVFLRIYIGRSADADAKGRKKKGWAYIVWAIILAALDTFGVVNTWRAVSRLNLLSTIVSSVLDLASLGALIDLIISAINVKRLRKALAVQAQGI